MNIVQISSIILICCNINMLCAQESPSVAVEGDSDRTSPTTLSNSSTLDQDDGTVSSLVNSLTMQEQPIISTRYNSSIADIISQPNYQDMMPDLNHDPECPVTLVFFRKVEIGNSDHIGSQHKNVNLKNLTIKQQRTFLSQFLGSGLRIMHPLNKPIFSCHIKSPMAINNQIVLTMLEKFIKKYLFSLG